MTEINLLYAGLVVLLLMIVALIAIADRLVKMSAEKVLNLDEDQAEAYSILPSFNEFFGKHYPNDVQGKVVKLKKGMDISISGKAESKIEGTLIAKSFALKPDDFIGMSPIPKLMVEVGDQVKAGDPIFFDKKNPEVIYCAPSSGEFAELKRGAKRKIEELIFLADEKVAFKSIDKIDIETADRSALTAHMMSNGVWPFIKQKPFDVIADAKDTPKSIFISGFDSAPLAADKNLAIAGNEAHLQTGINVLNKLTTGDVNLNFSTKNIPSKATLEIKNTTINWFDGPHPAGCVGVQIHHIDPINKDEIVWTINVEDVVTIGKLFNEGIYDPVRVVSVVGSEVNNPAYYTARLGANISTLLTDNLKSDNARIISGNVLTGTQIEENGFLSYFDSSVTAISEGDEYTLFGWMIPSDLKPSMSKSLPGYYIGDALDYDVDTNTNGEKRAMVVTGQYESVLPMDIYPTQLLKAILAKDFDLMEGLGIYEVSEEDFALCEFVCTSKTDVQNIIRQGLDLIREQG